MFTKQPGATDGDVAALVATPLRHALQAVAVRCSNVSDAGLARLLRPLPELTRLTLANCNDVTGQGLWQALSPQISW